MTDRKLSVLAATITIALVAGGAAQEAGSPSRSARKILSSGILRHTPNADLLLFLKTPRAHGLPDATVRRARAQLIDGLREATKGQVMAIMNNAFGSMGGMMHQAMKQSFSPGNMARHFLHLGPNRAAATRQANQMQQQGQKMVTDPWVRGLAAARALAHAGQGDEAADFYRRCLRFPMANPSGGQSSISWVTERCISGALDLGANRAGQIITYVYEHAWPDLGLPQGFGGKRPQMQPIPQVRAQAIIGFGRLVATGKLSNAQRKGVLDELIRLAKKTNDDRELDAAIRALAATGDKRAANVLRDFSAVKLGRFSRFTHRGRRAAHVSEATRRKAREALAVAFHDQHSIDALHHSMAHGNAAEAAIAAQALLEIDDSQAWQWIDRYLERSALRENEADYRQSIADSLVGAGGPRAQQALHQAIAVKRRNDWIEAYYRIALLRLGDHSQLQTLSHLASKTDWKFDGAGVLGWYHRLQPLLKVAAKAAMGLPTPEAIQTVLDFAVAERDRYSEEEARQRRKTLTFRWDLADALASTRGEPSLRLLAKLVDDKNAGVRLRAASALLQHDEGATAPLLAHALRLDYGGESGHSRSADIHVAELRTLVTEWPSSTATRRARSRAERSNEPALRFLALASR